MLPERREIYKNLRWPEDHELLGVIATPAFEPRRRTPYIHGRMFSDHSWLVERLRAG